MFQNFYYAHIFIILEKQITEQILDSLKKTLSHAGIFWDTITTAKYEEYDPNYTIELYLGQENDLTYYNCIPINVISYGYEGNSSYPAEAPEISECFEDTKEMLETELYSFLKDMGDWEIHVEEEEYDDYDAIISQVVAEGRSKKDGSYYEDDWRVM